MCTDVFHGPKNMFTEGWGLQTEQRSRNMGLGMNSENSHAFQNCMTNIKCAHYTKNSAHQCAHTFFFMCTPVHTLPSDVQECTPVCTHLLYCVYTGAHFTICCSRVHNRHSVHRGAQCAQCVLNVCIVCTLVNTA